MRDHSAKLWHFPGGLQLDPNKSQSTQHPIQRIPIPPRITLPVKQHIGEAADVSVLKGDSVYKGQPIAHSQNHIHTPVHASTSGTVVRVCQQPVPHPSGLTDLCVVIDTDGHDRWYDELPDPIKDYDTVNPARLRERVHESGIVGLGGAAFPTAIKLQRPIETLIINGVECEPYISCDDMLLRERSAEILEGVRILRQALEEPQCIIAIEGDMPLALEAMRQVLGGEQANGIQLVTIPPKYPAGGERQLIKTVTGREVPSDGLPIDIGIVCLNVGTANAIYHAVCLGKPLVSRIVTVTGGGVKQPKNVEAIFGTPMSHLIEASGGYTNQFERLIMGGPMMGFTLPSDQLPIIKATNCLLVASRNEVGSPSPVMPCIHCGDCARVCPAILLPQELYRYAQAKLFDKLQEYDLFDCIECGCCAYVCPSNLPLVQYYRFAKNEIIACEHDQAAAELARRHYEQRSQRLEHEKQEHAQRLARKKALLNKPHTDDAEDSRKAAIRSAVERVKAKKATH